MMRFIDWSISLIFTLFLLVMLLAGALVFMPDSPLPDRYNPIRPFDVNEPYGPLTNFKLNRSLKEPKNCLNALNELGVEYQKLSDRVESPQCHIKNRVGLKSLARSQIAPFETRCETALRLALWERHVVQPAAQNLLGQGVDQMLHFSSYSCRAMRTTRGNTQRMSEHSTANAVDISGFRLGDGQMVTLLLDWNDWKFRAFFRAVRDGACDWFKTTLSPDYNALHKDHFHFDQGRWRSCR